LDQQALEVLPLPANRILDPIFKGTKWLDGDLLKLFGFDGLEHRGDPLGGLPFAPELHVFEFPGAGEVKRRRPTHLYVRGKR
jgi:hypothetical protein